MNQHLKLWVYLFLLYNCLTGPNAYSQGLYKPGYIIHQGRDTQEFLIDFEARDICRIKENKKISELRPSDILGFGFKGNRFYSSQIIRDTFVEVLIEGAMSLFRFNRIYFIQKTNQPVVKLEKRPYRKVFRTNTYEIIEDNQWRGILRYLLADCQNIKDDFDKLNLQEKDLRAKVIEYNRCLNTEFLVNKSQLPLVKINIGIGIGWVHTALNLPRLESRPEIPIKFVTTHLLPVVSADLSSSKVFSKFSFLFELQYQKFRSLSESIVERPADITYYETFFNTDILSMPIMLNYKIPFKNIQVALLTGFQNDLILNQKNRLIKERFVDQTVITDLYNEAFIIKKQSIGLTAGIAIIKPLGNYLISCNLRFNPQRMVISAILPDGLSTMHPAFNRYLMHFTLSKR